MFFEVPFLYHTNTEKFGLSDTQIRLLFLKLMFFFGRNYSTGVLWTKIIRQLADKWQIKSFVRRLADEFCFLSFVFSGLFRLGSSSWSLSGGMVAGLVLTSKIALFPGVGYVHITKPRAFVGISKNGINLQTNMSVKFNSKLFLFVNPIVTIFDEALWSADLI